MTGEELTSLKPTKRARDIPSDGPWCWWGCGTKVANSPYRSPVEGIPGARYTVCGPNCDERPEGAVVFPV